MKLKTSDNTYLNNFASLNRFKKLKDKEIDNKENQRNEQEDLFRHYADQPQISDCITSSKPKAPTSLILGDSIVKNIYRNTITKSVEHQKYVFVKHFSGAKIADMNQKL